MNTQISVNFATSEDMEDVLELILELARYEKAESQVINTAHQLQLDGFGKNPAFECLIAKNRESIIGFALFYTSYSTWRGKCLYLEDLCVTEKFRQKGIGSLLFDRVLQIAKDRNMKRMEWQVLEWNEPAIQFYKKYNSNLDPEWINGKLILD